MIGAFLAVIALLIAAFTFYPKQAEVTLIVLACVFFTTMILAFVGAIIKDIHAELTKNIVKRERGY